MKNKRVLPSFLVILLTSCSLNANPITSKIFCFDTYVEVTLYEGKKDDLTAIESIFNTYDVLADNYHSRLNNNVYTINQTNEEIKIDEGLYKMLQKAFDVSTKGASNYNPLCGSLAEKWKDALKSKVVLDDETIESEVDKIKTSELLFLENNTVQRVGQAEIDLGGIAKGYSLDLVKSYLKDNNINKYLINAGSSSILLGEKNTKDGLFNVGFKDIPNAYIKVKNCVVSTSAISEQYVEIDGVKYSHIIDPKTGKANHPYDGVIVITEDGAFGDALCTSMMMNTIDQVKQIEIDCNVQTIVYKDNQITYKNDAIEVYYH